MGFIEKAKFIGQGLCFKADPIDYVAVAPAFFFFVLALCANEQEMLKFLSWL